MNDIGSTLTSLPGCAELTADQDALKISEVRTDISPDVEQRSPITVTQRISIENHTAEDFTAEYRALGAQERQPQEARLQCEYVTYLEAKGHKLSRHQIASDGTYLYTDIYDETTDDLIEVKSSTDRVTMRLALGQILDYAELIEPSPTIRTVLVPRQPTRTIIDLFKQHGVRIVWANDGYAFTASDG